jgi:hypothetical protein
MWRNRRFTFFACAACSPPRRILFPSKSALLPEVKYGLIRSLGWGRGEFYWPKMRLRNSGSRNSIKRKLRAPQLLHLPKATAVHAPFPFSHNGAPPPPPPTLPPLHPPFQTTFDCSRRYRAFGFVSAHEILQRISSEEVPARVCLSYLCVSILSCLPFVFSSLFPPFTRPLNSGATFRAGCRQRFP